MREIKEIIKAEGRVLQNLELCILVLSRNSEMLKLR